MGKLRGAAIGFAVTSALLAVAAWFGVPLSRPGEMTGGELAAAGFSSVVAGTAGGLLAVGRLGAAREALPEDRWLAGLAGPALAGAVHIALLGAERTIDLGIIVVVGGLLAGGVLGSRGATTPGDLDPGEAPDLHWRHRLPGPSQQVATTDPQEPGADPDATPTEATESPPRTGDAAPSGAEGPNGSLGPPPGEG